MQAALAPTNAIQVQEDRPLFPTPLVTLLTFMALLSPHPVSAADLVEPWDQGFSDIELYASHGTDTPGIGMTMVLGFGLVEAFSIGATLSDGADGAARLGVVALYSRRLGGGVKLDLFGETGVQRSAEAELDSDGDWLAGLEWSLHRATVIPYLRTTMFDAPDSGGFHPLFGLMIPAGNRVELHLELSSESPEGGSWPLHVAIGPNARLGETVEILPEISMLQEREDGETHWQFSLGLVIDPRGRSFGQPRRSGY
jgi:hypothetical protein